MAGWKRYRLGLFLLDTSDRTIRSNGTIHALAPKEFDFLLLMVEHPGEVVLRKDLQQRIWPQDTFVDFDHGLNVAIQKLRLALGDSSENPKFVETLPRRLRQRDESG